MHIKGDLFRTLNMELSRSEVKAKLDDAALNQKNNLNVDLNQKSLLNEDQKLKQKKKKKSQNESEKEKNHLKLISNTESEKPDLKSKEDQVNQILKKLNSL